MLTDDKSYKSGANVKLVEKLDNIAAEKGYELPKFKTGKTDSELYTCTMKFLTHTIETKAATEDLALYLCASNMLLLCECPYELKSSTCSRQISVTFVNENISEPVGEVENKFKPTRKLDPVSYLNGFARKTRRKLPQYFPGVLSDKGFSVICRFMERTTEGSSVKKKIAKKKAAFEMIKIIGLDASMVIDYSVVVDFLQETSLFCHS